MKKLIFLLCLVGLLSQFSCTLLVEDKKTITIEDVSWYIENVSNDRWSVDNLVKPSLVYNFEIFFKEDISASDIESVRVYLPNNLGTYWTIDKDYYFNPESKSIGGTTHCWYTGNPRELPIGTLTAEIMLTNGKSDIYSFTMGRPGSLSTGGYYYVYSVEDEAVPSYISFSTPAIMRPVMNELSFVNGHLSTTFTVRGNFVRNGWIWYYDSNNEYVGRSVYFADQVTGLSSTKFAAGYFRTTPDTQNTLIQDPNDITGSDGQAISLAEMNSIRYCRVYVTDGDQYSGHFAVQYDYRAMSDYF